jgi:hypothetical protein
MVAVGVYGIVVWKYFALGISVLLGSVGFFIWATGLFLSGYKHATALTRLASLIFQILGFLLFAAQVTLDWWAQAHV